MEDHERVDPDIECKDERISYKMNLSAREVQTDEIFGDGAELMEKIYSQFEGEYD